MKRERVCLAHNSRPQTITVERLKHQGLEAATPHPQLRAENKPDDVGAHL